jgi:hypothetical protein
MSVSRMRPVGTAKRLSRRLILAGVASPVLTAAACSGDAGVEETAGGGSGAVDEPAGGGDHRGGDRGST